VIAIVSGFVDRRKDRKLLTGAVAGSTTAVIIMAEVIGDGTPPSSRTDASNIVSLHSLSAPPPYRGLNQTIT
jgi:hypothetical protein